VSAGGWEGIPPATPPFVEVAPPAEDPPPEPEWVGGSLVPYAVGDPGRAAREVVAALPANPQEPADTQLDAGTAGDLVVRAASVRGTSHRHAGTPRQDDYAICADDRWLIVAVADGVSAGPLSHQAATLACRGAAGLVRDRLGREGGVAGIVWADVLSSAARRIVAHGRRALESDADDGDEVLSADVARMMATTLVVAVIPVRPGDDGRHEGTVLALGDTSAFVLGADRAWRAITDIKNDGADIASSATAALPYLPSESPDARPVTLERGEVLLVMTDGVGDALGTGDGAVGRFLGSEWQAPPEMLSFGGQVGFARRSFDDDRTVVGVWTAAAA
jgi:serine/threonine protein phosphatase PrpC